MSSAPMEYSDAATSGSGAMPTATGFAETFPEAEMLLELLSSLKGAPNSPEWICPGKYFIR